MPILFAPIAPPAAGKSFFVNGVIAAGHLPSAAVISPDRLREILTGNQADQSANRQVFEMAHAMVRSRLAHGFDVFFDATNLTARGRDELVAIAGDQVVPADIVWIMFSSATRIGCTARNEVRANPVPPEAMARMFKLYEELDWDALPGRVMDPANAEALMETSASTRRATMEGMN